ncbi:ATP-binding cassette domain-containing protein [Xylophilus rhododendri]|uniref:ATP-binding cassette domain-containing protein n=1 Tax=Xylophilus rhododendri TaxID=2697032 RepID=A0A857J4Z8_9BURK|nr:ABC transporter ATP-binding protein/permease [Xylophilus rhododendri]QHI98886.1 ATP-binding cassette domain-containing protein [Xylophilus rhododendri]
MTTQNDASPALPAAPGTPGTADPRGRLRLADSWRLLKPYWVSEDRKAALSLLAVVVGLNLAVVAVNVWLNNWNRVFYNTLESRDFPGFKTALAQFCAIAAVFIVVAVLKQFATMRLEMRWRTWMTNRFLDRWMAHQAYYRIEQGGSADNPDQRISEDIRSLTSDSLTLSLGLLNSVVTLLSFIAILWTLSGPLSFALGGHAVTVPGYMVWVALLYAVAGSWITHKVGKPLIGLYFRQEQTEASFRYGLVRLRENAEGVALYHGEGTEKSQLRERFELIRENWHGLVKYMRRLVFVNSGYSQAAIVFPLIVAAPRYFSGQLTLGGLMQINSAFGQVQGALSWFVDSYASLVNWQASANRLLDLEQAIAQAEHDEATRDGRQGIAVADSAEGAVTARGLVLNVPGHADHAPLTAPVDLSLNPGERWLVSGPSGSGKSVLFRALAGIWPYGGGRIEHPAGKRLLFLPQKSYVPSGTLAEALTYPQPASAHAPELLRALLHDCRLDALAPRLDEVDNWSLRLSPGEQQRLAFGRAVLHKPDYLFLDEATSALDEESEAAMYALVRERLPQAAVVSIAHRSTVARWHERQLRYLPQEGGTAPFAPAEVPLQAG